MSKEMKRIFRYEVPKKEYFKLLMSAEADILDVQFDRSDSKVYLYASFCLDSIEVEREFVVIPTGQKYEQLDASFLYIGTFQRNQVNHLFEVVL